MTPSTHQHDRIAIVGATGKVSHQLITRVIARGDAAVAVFRNADRYNELAELGAIPVVLDIESATAAQLAEVFAGSDAVVFSAGAGGGDAKRTRSVDYDGAVKTIEAATAAGVRRFVMVSAIGAGDTPPAEGDMAAYYSAKHDADIAVTESSLRWTILRPGGLTDDAPTGAVTIGDRVARGTVTRADVAATILAVLDEPGTVGHAWEFVNGPTPIGDAVAALV